MGAGHALPLSSDATTLAQWCVPTRRLVLASASAGRLRLLTNAGLYPEVIVSGVPEDDVLGPPRVVVGELARRKALAVAEQVDDALVIGCDSLLDLDGVGLGKPATPAEAVARWEAMRGRSGTLLTGHCVIDTRTGARVADVAATEVRFGSPTDTEVAAYVATGEPLHVAGAFTLDGLAAPFLDGINGCAGNVIGLSLPLLRRLLHDLDVELVDLWF